MAFGQSSGPPATGKQVNQLLELLAAAGHSDFRDARGPMGFNQRQAGGKFTRDEADAFIEQLEAEVNGDGPPSESSGNASSSSSKIVPRRSASSSTSRTNSKPARKPARRAIPKSTSSPSKSAPAKQQNQSATLDDVPSEVLAEELQRRGWVVLEP